ncbi:hypothetical protein [Streptomyces sp900116325]|uniref:hypothetical protein n=1 Tax=Streptomyces sp. 900116325 TaxID=3154295 RepID=UPI0033FEC6E7
MPAYLIRHAQGKQRDDILVEDPALTLDFEAGWAVFRDDQGVCLAIPGQAGAHIERVQDPAGTAPQKE